MMRLLIIFSFLLITAVTQAQVLSVKKGSIHFRSDAPLELIKAKSDDLRGKVDVSKKQFAFAVKIASFKGFNSPLQKEHFNENYMETQLYPEATFVGNIIEDISLANDGPLTMRAKGRLTIHGVTQERIIKCDGVVKNGKLSLSSMFTVLLQDHNIHIPKVVHEKLASEIKVEVNATVE